MIDKVLSGNYLKEQGRTFILVSAVLFLLVTLLALFIGWRFGSRGLFVSAGAISLLLMALVVVFRQDELAAVLCIAVHLYVDWYLGMRFVALGLILLLLLVLYLTRSPQEVWVLPRPLWLWILLFWLALFPALRGYTLIDGVTYYLTVFFAPLIASWLGNLLAQDKTRVRRLFTFLAGLGTLLAIITLIQAATGTLLFSSARYDPYLAQMSNFQLFAGSAIRRTGSFFVDPDWTGTFFAMVAFIPLSLFFTSSTLRTRVLRLVEVFLIFLALLSTYSTGAWIASIAALLLFVALLGSMRSRLVLLGLIALISAVILIFFPAQLAHQLQHATAVSGLSLRISAWQAGIRVIETYPLTGVGLGLFAYLNRARSFRVLALYAFAHPNNSYLEIGAMGGLPLLILFLALLFLTMWWALRNWARAEAEIRVLLAGGIAAVVALSINSLGSNSWTLAPLTALGWLIIGVISSPLLAKQSQRSTSPEQDGEETETSLEQDGEETERKHFAALGKKLINAGKRLKSTMAGGWQA